MMATDKDVDDAGGSRHEIYEAHEVDTRISLERRLCHTLQFIALSVLFTLPNPSFQ